MTLKANGVTWLRRTVLPQGPQGSNGACPPAPPSQRCRAAACDLAWGTLVHLVSAYSRLPAQCTRLIQQRLQPRFEGSLSLRDGGGMRQLNTIYQRIGINGTEDGQTSGARR